MNPLSFNRAYEELDTLEFMRRDASDFWFACVDIEVIKDRRLSPCDKTVFAIVCGHVNVQTRSGPLRIKSIAEEVGCNVRSVQESMKILFERGIIERVERFENGKQRASLYKIIGHLAPCYRGAKSASCGKSTPLRGTKKDTSLRGLNAYEVKDTHPLEREAILLAAGTEAPASDLDLSEGSFWLDKAPVIMKETLDYFLLKTGRAGIAPEELSALYALEKIHTPQRVNKEIAGAIERFQRNGRLSSELTLIYIYKSLRNQNSLKYVKDKSFLKQEMHKEESPDPYAGAYL
jgi:hypothetical protein